MITCLGSGIPINLFIWHSFTGCGVDPTYISRTQMGPLVLPGNGLVLRGWPSKIEVIRALHIYIYTYIHIACLTQRLLVSPNGCLSQPTVGWLNRQAGRRCHVCPPGEATVNFVNGHGSYHLDGSEIRHEQQLRLVNIYSTIIYDGFRLVVEIYHYIPWIFSGFYDHPRWLSLGFLNHQQCVKGWK